MKNKNKTLIKWVLISLIGGILLISSIIYFSTSDSSPIKNDSEDKIRIVSLMPSLTQSIYYLDAQNKLVGCTNYCQVTEADSIEVVSSVMKPNIEKNREFKTQHCLDIRTYFGERHRNTPKIRNKG